MRPFLANVLRGRRVSPERVEEVARHYEFFGGVSPLTALTRGQAAGLADRLTSAGHPLPVHVGMRNWHPFLADTLTEMSRAGLRRAIGVIAAPHHSSSSREQYQQNVADARAELATHGVGDVDVTYVDEWFAHDGFITANAAHVEDALARLSNPARATARLVFTAHSIPLSMAEQSPYREQLAESSRLVAARAGRSDWALAYQSRSGRPEDPWLGPDIGEYLRDESARGLTSAVVCPIGFVCDHVEVLYDLDREAAAIAREAGVELSRAAAANLHPAFLDMLADVVLRAIVTHS